MQGRKDFTSQLFYELSFKKKHKPRLKRLKRSHFL